MDAARPLRQIVTSALQGLPTRNSTADSCGSKRWTSSTPGNDPLRRTGRRRGTKVTATRGCYYDCRKAVSSEKLTTKNRRTNEADAIGSGNVDKKTKEVDKSCSVEHAQDSSLGG